jgi:uridine kinase
MLTIGSRPVVVGLSGPSCSGKTTAAERLRVKLVNAVHLQQDLFFIDPALCSDDANFCDLRYLHVGQLVAAFEALASGQRASVPRVDFTSFQRLGTDEIEPAPWLLVEGMTIFRVPEIARRCDYRFYLAPDLTTLEQRKRMRDRADRRKTPEVIEAQLRWVRAEYEYDRQHLRDVVSISEAEDAAQRILEEIT